MTALWALVVLAALSFARAVWERLHGIERVRKDAQVDRHATDSSLPVTTAAEAYARAYGQVRELASTLIDDEERAISGSSARRMMRAIDHQLLAILRQMKYPPLLAETRVWPPRDGPSGQA